MLSDENGVKWERERCERIGDLGRGAAPGRNCWENNREAAFPELYSEIVTVN